MLAGLVVVADSDFICSTLHLKLGAKSLLRGRENDLASCGEGKNWQNLTKLAFEERL